jgi:hypothetical protein
MVHCLIVSDAGSVTGGPQKLSGRGGLSLSVQGLKLLNNIRHAESNRPWHHAADFCCRWVWHLLQLSHLHDQCQMQCKKKKKKKSATRWSRTTADVSPEQLPCCWVASF